jgi:4-amino-4-deoxy-L-arabinose transferase-like glycosyltransferase
VEHVAAGFGSAPWNLRLVPIAAGIALIPLLAALGRRVAGDAAGLWTGAFVAVLPAALFTSANARMYGPAGALIVAAALLLWRATERPEARRWIAFAAVAAAAVWTDYFSAVALAGVLLAAAWLRPSRRVYAMACLGCAAAVASLLPWPAYAGDQLNHAGQGFWVAPPSPFGLAGTAGQLFAGPKSKAELPLGNLLLALQIAAAVGGWLALAGLVLRRRSLSPSGRRAAVFCLLACGGVVALGIVSIWRPLLEARYAGVMWLPLFALAGTGLALLPRRAAGILLTAVAVPGLVLSVAVTHSGTADLLPGIEARMGAHDLVAADPDHYLLALAEGSPSLVARLHVLAAADPPWYFGTAAYPPDAVVHAVPDEVVANGGLIFYVGDPGSTPALLPPGYREQARQCVTDTCLAVYGR